MIFKRALFNYVTLTVWLIMDVKVEAFKNGCSGGYCFVISDYTNSSELLDLSTAQQRCQSNGTQLVEIRNKDIQNSVVDFIRSAYSQGLGGWNVLTNGKKSPGNWMRLNSNGISGITVYGQPDASYAYGYLKSTTSGFDLFASRPTDNIEGFICTGLLNCSGGVTISGQCYRSFTETLSWYEARNRCLVGGGDLASFDHITTNAGFNALNGSWINPRNSYWIGIRREWWTWQNTNSEVKFSEWTTGHPINYQANSDCLCLSTTELKWIECGCNQQLPFVCISGQYSTTPSDTRTSTKTTTTTTPTTTSITTSTTTRSTTSTIIRSTSTAFTTKDASKATSRVTSESNGVSTPTIPATVTSNSTSAANDTESLERSMRLGREATIGIGVGVGVGGAVVIIALVAALVILCRKRRCPLRCPRRKKTDSKALPPHIPTQDSKNNDHSSDGMESLYASVVPSSPKQNNVDTNALENSNETSTVYAQLGFHRDGSVIIVPGKTKPSPVPRPPATNGATKRCNVGDDINAGIAMA